MKKYILLLAATLILVGCGSETEVDNRSVVEKLNEDFELEEEFVKDTKQVYNVVEVAHEEDRGLTHEEELLLIEYEVKYEHDKSNERQHMIYTLISIMSTSTVETSQLESNKGFYDNTKEALLDYIDIE